MHKPGELMIARDKVSLDAPHCVAKQNLGHFRRLGAPQMLIIGASHVSRLESFCFKKSTPERFVKPFEETHYISVGGTTWEDCLQHFR